MNVFRLALAVEKWSAGHAPVSVQANTCLNARDKSSDCSLCVQACPTEAISLQGGVQLQADACIQCGLCLRQCPTGVFQGDDGAHKLLRCTSQIVDHETIEIACKHHPDPARGSHKADAVITTNGCLSRLSSAAYLALFGLGVQKAIIRLDACAACPLGALCPQIEDVLHTAHQLMDDKTALVIAQEPPEHKAKTRPLYSVSNPPVSRRGLLRMVALQGANSADELLAAFAAQQDDDSLLPQERRRLLTVLHHTLPVETEVTLPEQDFTRLKIDGNCTACGLCARICPTEAIWFEESADTFALTFSSADCVNCGLCISLCETQVLQRDGTPPISEVLEGEVVTLYSGRLKRCRKCNVPFRGEGDYCPTCAFRKKNPFGFVPNPREHLAGSP